MMNIFIIAAAAGIAAIIYLMTKKKITNGSSCCGGHEKPVEHVKAGDTNVVHYPYHYILKVEGMVCANCAKRVENAFNKTGEMLALADLGKREVRLSSKRMLDRRETAKIVDSAGYTLMGFDQQVN